MKWAFVPLSSSVSLKIEDTRLHAGIVLKPSPAIEIGEILFP